MNKCPGCGVDISHADLEARIRDLETVLSLIKNKRDGYTQNSHGIAMKSIFKGLASDANSAIAQEKGNQ